MRAPAGTLAVMRFEEPTWDGPYFGQFGVLADDGDNVKAGDIPKTVLSTGHGRCWASVRFASGRWAAPPEHQKQTNGGLEQADQRNL